jgi:lysyl-tRNA synthetase class 1
MHESPGRDQITPFALDHWWERAQEVQHPVLRGRYADLVWDLSRRTERKPPIDAARLLIDAYIAAAERDLAGHVILGQDLLRRALDVAMSIKDVTRVAAVRDAILAFERRTAQNELLGTWGFAFDQLIEPGNVSLTGEQENSVIAALETRLATSATTSGGDPFAAESAATRLARYYRRKQRGDDVARVLRLYTTRFQTAAKTVAPLVGLAWIERVHELLREFGLGEDARALGPLLQRLGEETRDNLHPITAEVRIPRETFEAFVAEVSAGTIEDALDRITAHFLHQRGEVEVQVKQLA